LIQQALLQVVQRDWDQRFLKAATVSDEGGRLELRRADAALLDVARLGPEHFPPSVRESPGKGEGMSLERRGPGPFQALYRTTGMGAAARWMEEHGMPPPKRGIRSNGEHAMLATPEFTCGAYIGFVGPE
jgi:hypothetical protein